MTTFKIGEKTIVGISERDLVAVNHVRSQVEDMIGIYTRQIEGLDDALKIIKEDLEFVAGLDSALEDKEYYKEVRESRIKSFNGQIESYENAKKETEQYLKTAQDFLQKFDDNTVASNGKIIYNSDFFDIIVEFARVFVKTEL